MHKILLIEDNKEISNNIKLYLELEDYDVDVAYSWDIWLDKATTKTYDLILLDLMLPVIDWFTICEKLTRKIETPIIMITAKDSIEDKIKWFEKWTVDYIVKPFDLRELDARIKSTLSRNWTKKDYEFENVMLSIGNRIFKVDWKDVNITQKEYLILDILFQKMESGASRTDIIDYVWWEEDLFNADPKLDVYISWIRSKLNKNLIKTIKGYWYRINKS